MSQTGPAAPEHGTEREQRVALAALFVGAAIIGLAPIFVRWSQTGPTATAFWRLALATPGLWLWMLLEPKAQPHGTRRPSPLTEPSLAVAGLCFAADLGVWHASIRLTSVANATLLANFAPVFVALFGWLLWRSRVRAAFALGMAVALAGMVVLMGQSARLGVAHLHGDLLGLLTAVFYAAYLLAVKRLRENFSTATIMAWSSLISGLALLPAALALHEPLWPADATGWAVLLGLALLVHIGGQSLIGHALAHLPATFSAIGLLVQPVFATLFAWAMLGEKAGAWQAVGGALVLAGIILARRESAES